MLDYIVVGQGIAGSMLSWFLLKENQHILLIDKFNPSSATHVAPGITNPVTGRKFVKTWLADDLIPFADATWHHFESIFSETLTRPISIIKLFDSVKAQNDWSARCASAGYTSYLKNEQLVRLDPEKVMNDFGGFEIDGGSKFEASKFLTHYRNLLKKREVLLEDEFCFDDLEVKDSFVIYRGMQARCIIFSEGANAVKNPYFKFLPFQLAKGEVLTLKIEDFYADRIISGEVSIIPNFDVPGEYFIGATHAWNFDDDKPSDIGKNELLGNLSTVLNASFTIVNHRAAIRPTVKDRRPFVGFHPEYKNVGIFNGMGTKGVSLAPYFADHLVNHLLYGSPLMPEVDIKRFLTRTSKS